MQPGAGRAQQPCSPPESCPPSWRSRAALSSHSSSSSGGVCAMGDPERPEAARPDLDEVNVATDFSLVPQSHLASVLQIATRTSKVGNFTHCHRKAGAGRALSPSGSRPGGRPRGGRPGEGLGESWVSALHQGQRGQRSGQGRGLPPPLFTSHPSLFWSSGRGNRNKERLVDLLDNACHFWDG